MVTIKIVDSGEDRYQIVPDSKILGRMYDNNAEKIKVIFPDQEIENQTTCTMIVTQTDGTGIDLIQVYNNTEFFVTSLLSQFDKVVIGFSFEGTNYIKNTEYEKFKFSPALEPENFIPVDPAQHSKLNLLIGGAFVNVRWRVNDNNVMEFLNVDNEVVKTINVSGGGGTSDYSQLTNKPKINNVELSGNKSFSDLGLGSLATKNSVNYETEVTNKPNLNVYSLITETGNKIDMSIDSSTYILTLQLKDKNNNVLSTQTVDLPLETMVVNGSYDSVNKKIILTLKNGSTIEFSVADLISGLVPNSRKVNNKALSADITLNAKDVEAVPQLSTMPSASSSNLGDIVEYVGATDSNYTNGYFYKCVDNSVQESITATQTDNVAPLGTITVDNATFKSKVSAGTHEFVFKGYNTVLNFSNISVFPPVSIQVTRDSTFDRQPMIQGATKFYSWVDGSNNFYLTDTLQPNALTKLYLLDINTQEGTDTGATFISSNTPSLIEGRWTKKEGDVYTDVDLSEYGIYLTSAGLPNNAITVTYVEANTSYSWQQKNVQPEGSQGTTDYTQLTNKPQINSVELSGNKSFSDLGIINFSGNYNDLTNKPTIPTVSVSDTGTATDEVGYITINGTEKKIKSGGAVNSVNGQTGTVVLTASDVGALPSSTSIPTKTSDLTNDSNFVSNTIKTTLDNILQPNTSYFIGEQSLVSITLPSTGSAGQIISVDFTSGATPTSLTISGNVAGDITFAPEANKLIEINFKFDGTYFKMLVSSIDIPSGG